MAQDIREMFRKDKSCPNKDLRSDHEERFAAKLEKEFPQKKKRKAFPYLKIAAVLVVAVGIGLFMLKTGMETEETQIVETPTEKISEEKNDQEGKQFQLSDISPQYKEIENYYMASLNLELAKLEINDKNKALIDAFMAKLAELDKEYKRLNADLQESGPNERTVEAMVANLQLRLELLFKLKNKIKEINESQQEDYEDQQA